MFTHSRDCASYMCLTKMILCSLRNANDEIRMYLWYYYYYNSVTYAVQVHYITEHGTSYIACTLKTESIVNANCIVYHFKMCPCKQISQHLHIHHRFFFSFVRLSVYFIYQVINYTNCQLPY